MEVADWVYRSGFTKMLIVNAHGGNVAPFRVAVDEIRCRRELRVGLVSWHELTPEIEREVLSDGEDVHANRAETAMLLHLRPQLVEMAAVEDDPDRTPGRVFSYTVAEASTNGVTGEPSKATAEEGERLFGRTLAALVDVVRRADRESSPLEAGL